MLIHSIRGTMSNQPAILIVCGGFLQIPAVHAAHRLGLRAVVTDANPSAPCVGIADESHVIDIFDVASHIALYDILAKRLDIRGVFTEGAEPTLTVAAVAAHAGLPGIPVEAALNTRHKARTRACFDKAGLPNPRWATITKPEEAASAAAAIGYPLMVKAADSSASRGVMRVDHPDQLASAVVSAFANSRTGTPVLEQVLLGSEHSAEILYGCNGVPVRLNIGDRLFARDNGRMIELGHINPSRLDTEQKDRCFALMERAAVACGIQFGAFKADIIWTAEGPYLLEVTARLSGGFDCQYTQPAATGRDFITAAMRLAAGLPPDPQDLAMRFHRHAAAMAAFPEPGRITAIEGVAEAQAMPGVTDMILRVATGDVIRPYDDCAARPAFAIAIGNSADEAISRATAAARTLRFRTTPT